jgi:hypothetical protein
MSSARRNPVFNPDDPTIMADVLRRSPEVAPSGVVIRTVPVVYDAADDGEELRATELFNVPGAMGTPVTTNRNFGGTALMPAAFSVEMRDAVMASTRHQDAQHPIPPASTPPSHASGIRAKVEIPAQSTELLAMGLTTFEIAFAVSAAVVVGLSAALLFVYLG